MTRASYDRAIRHIEKKLMTLRCTRWQSLIWTIDLEICGLSVARLMADIILCSIDGAKCDEAITNLPMFFYGKYNRFYNSVPYDKDEMSDIKCGIDNDLFQRGHKYKYY